jgi:mono/diheme cytochrome c family protein
VVPTMSTRVLKISVGVAVGLLAPMQFFRPERTNPPSDPAASFEAVARPPQEIASSLKRSCYDCHSNRTNWPWYSNVAPPSWLIASDVKEGRAHLNFSEWTRPGPEGEIPGMGEVCESVRAGKMPLWSYTLLHPDAKLTAQQVAAVCVGAGANE